MRVDETPSQPKIGYYSGQFSKKMVKFGVSKNPKRPQFQAKRALN